MECLLPILFVVRFSIVSCSLPAGSFPDPAACYLTLLRDMLLIFVWNQFVIRLSNTVL